MREIKFRYYDKEDNTMQGFGSMPMFVRDLENLDGEDHIIAMQYTGLKDKNGVEIYEGDILEYPDLDKGVYLFKEQPKKRSAMKWHEQDAAFRVPGTGFRINTERVEVIGNIHEHPHLLETKK